MRHNPFAALRSALPFALVLAACGSPSVLDNHDTRSPEIRGLSRLGQGGYVAGQTERFRAMHDPSALAPQWTASAGTLVADGDTVDWTLPDDTHATLTFALVGKERTATASFQFDLTGSGNTTPFAAAPGPVDGTTDQNGSECDLGYTSTGNPMVAYLNDKHPSLWLSTWSGTAWQTQIVDGMGFQTGGRVDTFAMTTDSTGTPHFAYVLGNNGIWYATRSGNTWLRELVSASYYPQGLLAITIDSTRSNRPTIAFTSYVSGSKVAVAWRTGANTWTIETPAHTGDTTSPTVPKTTGGLAIASTGAIHVSFADYYNSNYVGRFTPGGTLDDAYFVDDSSLFNHPLAFDGGGKPILMISSALLVATPGATLAEATLKSWPFEGSVTVQNADFIFKNSKPYIVSRHSGDLELISIDASNFYTYTQLGTADNARPGVELDPTGAPHACFARSGKTYYQ